MPDVTEAIQQTAKLITKSACDDPPRPAQLLFGDPAARRRDRRWFIILRCAAGLLLVGVIAFAIWFYLEFSR